MKRDMQLVREILLAVEQDTEPVGWIKDLSIPGREPAEISHHVKLLHQAGLLEAKDLSTLTTFEWAPQQLTWSGHELLDAIRHDTVWKKVTSIVVDKGGSIPFEILKELAIATTRTYFGVSAAG
jgi:hypothetical protein